MGTCVVYKLIRRKPFFNINELVLKDSSVPKSENKPYLDYAPKRVKANYSKERTSAVHNCISISLKFIIA